MYFLIFEDGILLTNHQTLTYLSYMYYLNWLNISATLNNNIYAIIYSNSSKTNRGLKYLFCYRAKIKYTLTLVIIIHF